MKVSKTTNAILWAGIAIIAFSGIPVTILHPSLLGPIPMFGSLLAGVAASKLAYIQWRDQRIIVDFVKVAPLLLAGASVPVLLSFVR